MSKTMIKFEVEIQGMQSIFFFDSNCDVGVARLAILDCLKWIGKVEDAQLAVKVEQEAKATENLPATDEVKYPEQSE